MMSSYKLTYFNGQAKGEVSRLLFALGGVKYDDVRIEDDGWEQLKPKTPFGQLPTLEIDGGVTFCQQKAIEGYIARTIGRAGKTDIDFAKCHMIGDCVEDLFQPLIKTLYLDEEARKPVLSEFIEKNLPDYLAKFDKLLSSSGHFVGDDLTWADLSLYQILDNTAWFGLAEVAAWNKAIAQYPKILLCMKNVTDNERCAEWIAKRPKSDF